MYRGMLYNTGTKSEQNPEVTAMIAEMGEWARTRNHGLPDLAVQFPARHPALSTCIMGAQSATEVDGACFSASLNALCLSSLRLKHRSFFLRDECATVARFCSQLESFCRGEDVGRFRA